PAVRDRVGGRPAAVRRHPRREPAVAPSPAAVMVVLSREDAAAGRAPRSHATARLLVPHVVLLFACFVAIAPFVWSFFGSFKPFKELISSPDLLPRTRALAEHLHDRGH